jgi:hypothetical protein
MLMLCVFWGHVFQSLVKTGLVFIFSAGKGTPRTAFVQEN